MASSAGSIDYVRDLVYRRSGIVLDQSKQYLIETRLQPLAREVGGGSLDEVVRLVRGTPGGGLQNRLVEALTTNETSFFRDPVVYDVLRQTVIPKLMELRAGSRSLTIWSAACSTGQEPYSLAMMLRESFPQLATWRVRIIATDLAGSVLARAKEGRFRQLEVNRGLPAHLLPKYFHRADLEWEIKPEIRAMIEFREMNLIEPWPVMPMVDLLLLRNVLIYFDLETKRGILRKARGVMGPGARMLLGSAETTLNIDDNFDRQCVGPVVIQSVK